MQENNLSFTERLSGRFLTWLWENKVPFFSSLIFGLIAHVPLWLCLLLPFTAAGCKVFGAALSLMCRERFGATFDDSKGNILSKSVIVYVLAAVLLGAAYLLPLGEEYALPMPVSAGILLAMIPAGLLSWKKVYNPLHNRHAVVGFDFSYEEK